MSPRLHLVIGYDALNATASPTVVYCGRDGDEARAAMEPDPRFAIKRWVRNPKGIRKVNDAWVAAHTPAQIVSAPIEPTAITGSGESDLSGEGEAGELPLAEPGAMSPKKGK
jgi:hypothetical protein